MIQQLKKIFGYNEFREGQANIVQSVINKNNILAIMPTGSGKSLCYQLPAVSMKGTAIVVSPLIALMKNQVDFLESKGIAATFLNSTLGKKKSAAVKQAVVNRKLKLIYIAPETLNKQETIDFLKVANISFIAIDEAHCISEWGYDFRPEYNKLRNTIEALGNLPVAAFTATATLKVQDDIIKKLDIANARLFKSSFARTNLYYEIRPKKNPEKQIIQFLKANSDDTGIIYCHSRKKVEEVAQFLNFNDVAAAAYHAGLDSATRISRQDDFLGEKIRIMVATIAFGMGIDKPNVRFIIHYDSPKSLENYYQETGRAGRDGKVAKCIFFYDPKDIDKLEKLNANKSVSNRENANILLSQMRNFALSSVCIRKQILKYFGESYEGNCGQCSNCLKPSKKYEGQAHIIKILQATHERDCQLNSLQLSKFLSGIEGIHTTSNSYEQSKVFGIDKEKLPTKWISIIYQCLLNGYIGYSGLSSMITLTKKGHEFLQKPHSALLLEDHNYSLLNSESQLQKEQAIDEILFHQLIALRNQEAQKKGIKPYLIFQEQMIRDMTLNFSTTINALATLPGISLSKARKFGVPFVELIRQYVLDNDIETVETVVIKRNSAKFAKRIQLIKQIDKKINLEDLADLCRVSYEDLIKELEEICYSGVRLNLDYYIDSILEKDQQEDLYSYFYEQESDNIERACDELADDYDEDQVRLMHIKFLSEVAN